MSIWISKPAAALALASLAACAGVDFAPPSRAVLVQGGAVRVAPPAGYCADPKASTDSSGSAVVLMGRCSAASLAVPALITASIGAEGTGAAMQAGPVALTSFFTSEAGRAMLASSGRAGDAIVQASEVEEGAVVLRVKDAALGDYWRAILALKGRLVMLSATGAGAGSGTVALPAAEGRALLSKSMIALRRANPEAAPAPNAAALTSPALTSPAATAPVSTTPPPGTLRPRPRVPISG